MIFRALDSIADTLSSQTLVCCLAACALGLSMGLMGFLFAGVPLI